MSTAIQNAAWHGIKVNLVKPNKADGNCIFESVADNINTRPCFKEFLYGTPDEQRN